MRYKRTDCNHFPTKRRGGRFSKISKFVNKLSVFMRGCLSSPSIKGMSAGKSQEFIKVLFLIDQRMFLSDFIFLSSFFLLRKFGKIGDPSDRLDRIRYAIGISKTRPRRKKWIIEIWRSFHLSTSQQKSHKILHALYIYILRWKIKNN